MQILTLTSASELVAHAAYDPEERMLYLTYHTGNTTIAYQDVSPQVYDELREAAYPDVVIRFGIQARHSFRRVSTPYALLNREFIK